MFYCIPKDRSARNNSDFLGFHFKHTLSAKLLGGVRKDAELIISHLSGH